MGSIEPRRLLDMGAAIPNEVSLPGPSAACADPAVIYPDLLANVPFQAMVYAHTIFSSDFDAQLDVGKELKVFVKGSYDDFEAWDSLTHCDEAAAGEDCYCSYLDRLTQLEYRAVRIARTGAGTMACALLDRTRAGRRERRELRDRVLGSRLARVGGTSRVRSRTLQLLQQQVSEEKRGTR